MDTQRTDMQRDLGMDMATLTATFSDYLNVPKCIKNLVKVGKRDTLRIEAQAFVA
jgi:hypothetical protein